MNKTVLIGMTAIALSLGACAKRTPPPIAAMEPPPVRPGRSDRPQQPGSGRASRRCRPTWSPRPGRTPSISGPTNIRWTRRPRRRWRRRRAG